MGDHLRRRRLHLGLFQKQVADLFGASEASVNNWELNERQPEVRFVGKIVDFLGYDPFAVPSAAPIGERLRAKRRRLGLAAREACKVIGVDETTLLRWERGDSRKPTRRLRELFRRWLEKAG